MKLAAISRWSFFKAAATVGVMLVVLGGATALAQDDLALPESEAGELTVIHRTEYFEEVQNLFRETVEDFAEQRNIDLDISTANPEQFGDFTAKMLAAVQAGNAPDLAYHTLSIPQLHALGLLEDVTDVVEQATAMYGEVVPTSAAKNAQIDGRWWAVPFMSNTGAWFARKDVFDAAGIDVATLDTWDARREAALAVSDPENNMWGWGLTINRSGDGHGFIMDVIQAFGGSITDESGQVVTFDSPETVEAVRWLEETYTSEKYQPMLPPGIESWTDVSNNEAYLAGTVALTANAFSVYANAKAEGNPIYENTAVLHKPKVEGQDVVLETGQNGWFTIFKGSQDVDAAKDLILTLLEPENFVPMVQLGGGLFLPAYQDLWTEDLVETDENFAVIEEIIFNPVEYDGISYPAEPSAAIDAVLAAAIPSQMMANVTTGRMTAEEAVRDAHQKIVDIFEEGGIMQP